MEKEYLFLLGGKDLEMITIKELLLEHNFQVIDKWLSWSNASWDSYKEEFENKSYKNRKFVGIELQNKENKAENCTDIDHHNFDSENDSSLEQIANLINVKLNRWQQLVAANDKGYISELEKMCATKDEVFQVRDTDKKAQGVTDKDEKLAEESIEKNKIEKNGITIIRSLSAHFSPITDLMYGKTNKLLIYTDHTLVYYGEITTNLIDTYKNEIDCGKVFYGGKKNAGFLGFAKGHWEKNEIEEQKNRIIEIMKDKEQKLYSHHIFLFPFRWKNWEVDEDAHLNEKFDLNIFQKNLLQKKEWKRSSNNAQGGFQLSDESAYNEYNYYYDFVRKILYDLHDDLRSSGNKKSEKLIRHFEYSSIINNESEKLYYYIRLFGSGKLYQLEIDSIILNMYSTGVGVLSFHLKNKNYSKKEDVLKINKFGRRLFVPFFDLQADSIYTGEKDSTPKDMVLCATKKNEIPDAIWIGKDGLKEKNNTELKHLDSFENFERYSEKNHYKNGPFQLPKFIEFLFEENFVLMHEKEGYNGKINNNYKLYLRPALDDRMFVVSWYGNTDFAKELSKIEPSIENNTKPKINNSTFVQNNTFITPAYYSFETNKDWYSYIFVDTSPMHTNIFQRQELIRKSTYSRWVGWGTTFGFSRYSMVMLTNSFCNLEKDNVTYLVRHLQTMYYKMAELALVQRASILSFSDEITHVSDLVHSDEEKAVKKIEELYEHYILFVNKIYFREVTAQEQGIEMYDMLQKSLRIPEQVKDLDNEMNELNQFAGIMADKNEKEEMKTHTLLATIFLPFMLMSGFFGMNYFSEKEDINWWSFLNVSVFFFSSIIVLGLSFFIIKWDYFKKRNLHIPILMLMFWGIFGAIFLYLT